jgi:hypothetical protein
MPRRFLVRATLIFAALLPLWWCLLRMPLLDWVQFSTEALLESLPGVHAPTGVSIETGRLWNLQVPIPEGRSIHIRAEERVATVPTIALPLFWAVLLAAPGSWRPWSWRSLPWQKLRALAIGSAILLVLPAVCVLVYAAHVVQVNLYPAAAPSLRFALKFADYLNTVVPYCLPILLALLLDPGLRALVLSAPPAAAPPAAIPPAARKPAAARK